MNLDTARKPLAALTLLSPAQQTSIGLACGGQTASFSQGLTTADCAGLLVTSKLLTLPQAGMENDDHSPDRVKARQVLNLGIGSDDLSHPEKREHFTGSVEIANPAIQWCCITSFRLLVGRTFCCRGRLWRGLRL